VEEAVVRVTRSRTSYDFDLMTDKQKIDFFFKNKMPGWFIPSLQNAMEGHEYMLAGLLVMTGIDMLGGYYEGHPSDRGSFTSFLEEYFDYFKKNKATKKKNPYYQRDLLQGELNSEEYFTLSEITYVIFRCGFAYNFMVYQGGWFTKSRRYYVRRYKHRGYQIDINRLCEDFLKACKKFELDVRIGNDIRKNFLNRFNQLWKRG
jgi:hypothetical protein